MIDNLYQQNISEHDILKLINYFKAEKYETETVDLDLFLTQNGGNINKHMMNNKGCMERVIDMFKKTRSYVLCVSFCPCYYYQL